MSATTIYLGRLLGLYIVAIAVGMLVNRRRTMVAIDEMARSGPWMLFSGMVVEECSVFRVTRNADLTLEDEDADDLLAAVELELRRRRFGRAVRP